MSRRPRPQYRSGLGWILGVAFPDTLTRPARLAQGFTYIRCCGSPRASSPHGLTAPALASHDGKDCVQLPPARGCYHLAPRRTFTSNPVPMPGTPGRATPSLRPTPMRQRQQTRQDATYRSRKSVQTTGASSIDLRIAIDVIRLAHTNVYDLALIFCRDQDFSEVADEVKLISKSTNRWIKVASGYPFSPAVRNYRGINNTQWIPISRTLYDTCLDKRDYRPKKP